MFFCVYNRTESYANTTCNINQGAVNWAISHWFLSILDDAIGFDET